MTRSLLAALLAALVLPASALAEPAGSTLLQSRPSGLGVLPAGVVNDSYVGTRSVSADGCRVVFASHADGLSAENDDRRLNVFFRDVCAQTTTLVTARYAGKDWLGNSGFRPAISPNGRFVVFTGSAQNEEVGAPGTAWFRLDLTSGTRKVMTRSGSSWAAIVESQGAAVSDAGQLAFVTSSSLTGADSNGGPDAYSTDGDTFTLASRADGASGSVGGGIASATISADGTTVGFVGESTLVPGDSNNTRDAYARRGDATILVSRGNGAGGTATGGVSDLDLDADGSVAAFSTTTAADATDTNGVSDVYVRDGDATTLISRAGAVGNQNSGRPSLSADGSLLAFESLARNLTTPAETNFDWDVFLADREDGTVTVVSRAGAAGDLGTGSSSYAGLAADGGRVVFQTGADNLVSDDDDDFQAVVSRTIASGQTELVSRPEGDDPFVGGIADAGPDAVGPVREAISADGRFMLFLSPSDSLSDADDDDVVGAYVRDNRTDTTTFVSRADGAAGEAVHAPVEAAALSDDGRTVAFVTAGSLDAADTDGARDVYVRDLVDHTTALVSAGTTSDLLPELSISGDGGEVAFVTNDSLVAGDLAGDDVYVASSGGGAPALITAGNGPRASTPSLDGDGSHVAFQTTTAYDTADVNGANDVYVRPVTGGAPVLASRATGAEGAAGTHESTEPSLSADGSRVAFTSTAVNLAAGDGGTERSVYVRDLGAEETQLVSRAPGADGAVAGGPATKPAIDGDGTRVAFLSTATNLQDDLVYAQRVWVRDLTTHANTIASRPDGTASSYAPPWSDRPSISASGSCVGFLAKSPAVTPAYPVGDHGHAYLRVIDGDCPDESAPETTITAGPGATTDDTTPTLTLSASEAGATFTCAVDGGTAAACTSPHTLAALTEGAHTVAVTATDAAGNADPTPATRTFTVDVPDPPVEKPTDPKPDVERPRDDPPAGTRPGVTTPQPPVTTPPAQAALRILGRTLKVARSGRTTLKLACAGARCAGTVHLKAKVGKRTVVIARAGYAVAPGSTASVTLKLTAAGRKAVKRKLAATVAATGAAPQKVTLKR